MSQECRWQKSRIRVEGLGAAGKCWRPPGRSDRIRRVDNPRRIRKSPRQRRQRNGEGQTSQTRGNRLRAHPCSDPQPCRARSSTWTTTLRLAATVPPGPGHINTSRTLWQLPERPQDLSKSGSRKASIDPIGVPIELPRIVPPHSDLSMASCSKVAMPAFWSPTLTQETFTSIEQRSAETFSVTTVPPYLPRTSGVSPRDLTIVSMS